MAAGNGRLLVAERAGMTQEVPVAFGLSVGGGQPVLAARAPAGAGPAHVLALARAGAHMVIVGSISGVQDPWAEPELPEQDLARLAALHATGVPVLAEVEYGAWAPDLAACCAGLAVPARQMQNFSLLKVLGRLDCPVVLERGPACTVEEWLMAAEYVLAGGNRRVLLLAGASRGAGGDGCGRVDLAGALEARGRTHLPVLADAAAGLGNVAGAAAGTEPAVAGRLAAAALAAGLDGVALDGADPAELQAAACRLPLAPAAQADLGALRTMIDAADAELAAVLQRRLEVAAAIGRYKRARGLSVYQPRQEQRVLERAMGRAGGWLGADLVRAVWGAILRRSREVQAQLPPGLPDRAPAEGAAGPQLAGAAAGATQLGTVTGS